MGAYDNCFAYFRTDELKDAIPIEEVLFKYYGVSPNKNTIHCIKPDHDDKHASMAILDHKRCYCRSCNASMDIIDLAKDYYNIPQERLSEACFKLCEDFGILPEHVSDFEERKSRKGTSKKPEFLEHFPLTAAELREIGLEAHNGTTIYPSELSERVSWHYAKNRPENELTEKEKKIVEENKITVPPLRILWESDKKNVEKMLIEHIDSRIDDFSQFSKRLSETTQKSLRSFLSEGQQPTITPEGFDIYDMQSLHGEALSMIDMILNDYELPTHTEMKKESSVKTDENGVVVEDKDGNPVTIVREVPKTVYTPSENAKRLADMIDLADVKDIYLSLCAYKINDLEQMKSRITEQADERKKWNDEHKKKIKWRKELE